MDVDKLLNKLMKCKSQRQYDKLIDKYIFKINPKRKNTKSNEYNFLSEQQMRYRQRKEFSIDPDFL